MDQFGIVQCYSETNGLLSQNHGDHLEIIQKDLDIHRFPLQYTGYRVKFVHDMYDKFLEDIQNDPDNVGN